MNTRNHRQSGKSGLKLVFVGLLLLCSMTGLFAMAQQEAPAAAESFVVTDMRGRDVTVPGEVDSLIALGAGSLRLISYLNATDKVIAVEDAGQRPARRPYIISFPLQLTAWLSRLFANSRASAALKTMRE